MKSGIYLISNINNGRFYWGSLVNVDARWRSHIWRLNDKTHDNQELQADWNRFGANSFQFDFVESVPRESVKQVEQAVLDQYVACEMCYNIGINAESGMTGRKHSAATIEKMRLAKLGKKRGPPDELWRRKISEALRGKPKPPSVGLASSKRCKGVLFSEERKRKLSKAWEKRRNQPGEMEKLRQSHLGKKASETTRAKMSLARLGHETSEATREKISRANLGKKRSDAARKNISRAQTLRWSKNVV